MKQLIKGIIDQGHKVSVWKKNGMYVFDIDDNRWTISFEEWEQAEEVVLNYILEDAGL